MASVIVGIAEMQCSRDGDALLVTHALGSCLGITVHDPRGRVGGMLHVMLPDSGIDPAKAGQNPCVFMDSGMTALLDDYCRMGGLKHGMVICAAGGASTQEPGATDLFQIGRRNFIMLRRMLWERGLFLASFDVGGTDSRMLSLHIGSGEVLVKSRGVTRKLR